MREREIEDYLVKRVEAMGGLVRKVAWIGRNGAPDRLVMLPNGRAFAVDMVGHGRTVWVELKKFGKEPEPHQLVEHELMRKAGAEVVVIDSLNGVDELLA